MSRILMNKGEAFMDLPLSMGMMQTLKQVGFEIPTPIQKKSIPELLNRRDLLGQAQTGTGKTAAFAIPIIETVDSQSKDIAALVVCPTRELCLQVGQEIKRLSGHTAGINVVALYGGQAIDQQLRALRSQRPQIIVATPGRLFDHLRRKSIDLSTVKMIVLDEADEMLDMGFRDEIEQIFDLLPEENQRIFFSATMPQSIMDLVHNYLRDPIIIKTESKNITATRISQSYFRVNNREKMELLCRVLDYRDPKLAVVFCNAKSTADEITDEMKDRGFEAGVLHGDLSQNQRDRVMAKFKSGQIRILVATDIAARGIDIDDIELVLNFHLPYDPEDYVHRIGRTGRAGREGRAVSLVEPRENSRLRKITQFARTEIPEEDPPTIADVKAVKMRSLFGKIRQALSSEIIGEYRSVLAKQEMSSDDVAAGLIKMALEKFDEKNKDDVLFSALRGKKYSGFAPQQRRSPDKRDRRDGGMEQNFRRGPKNFDEPRRFMSNNRKEDGRGSRFAPREDGRGSRFAPKEDSRGPRFAPKEPGFAPRKSSPSTEPSRERKREPAQRTEGFADKKREPEGFHKKSKFKPGQKSQGKNTRSGPRGKK